MGCGSSRVDKIITAYGQNKLNQVLKLCEFEKGKITHNSISPYEIIEVTRIMKVIKNTKNIYDSAINSTEDESLLPNPYVDGVNFMITNVCYNIICLRRIPIMVLLLYKEKLNNDYLKPYIRNYEKCSNYGVICSSIITYLCFCETTGLSNNDLLELLKILQKLNIHPDVNPLMSIYKNDKGVEDEGNTILIQLAKRNDYYLIEYLLTNGCNYKQINKYGMTYYEYLSPELKNRFYKYDPHNDHIYDKQK